MKQFILQTLMFFGLFHASFAEKVIPSLSTHRVMITSNFSGTDLILYGLIERDANTISRNSGYDVIAVIRGRDEVFTVSEKERHFGLWLKGAKLTLPPAPSSYALYSNRDLKLIADFDLRQSDNLGLDTLLKHLGNDPSRLALLRLQKQRGLYRETEKGVVFLTPQWFRTRVSIPSNILPGQYRVEVFLLSGGVIIARSDTGFEVIKTGIESFLSRQAFENSWIFGVITAMISLIAGFLAFLIFRKD